MAKRKSKLQPTPAVWEIVIDQNFRSDLEYWIRQDQKIALRILALVEAIANNPFAGIGKPEPLKHLGSNLWSRRISQEHRLVYWVQDRRVSLLAARYHY